MLGMGAEAVKVGQNIAIACVGIGVAWSLTMHTARRWSVLRGMSYGTALLSMAYMAALSALAAGFYGAADVSAYLGGPDLRSWVGMRTAIGVAWLAGAAWHMVGLWRTDGYDVRAMVAMGTCAAFGLWVAAWWVLV